MSKLTHVSKLIYDAGGFNAPPAHPTTVEVRRSARVLPVRGSSVGNPSHAFDDLHLACGRRRIDCVGASVTFA